MVHLPKKVENLWGKSSQVDDTRSVEQTYRASSIENIFGRVRTHLRVQFGPFLVQNGPFMVHLPKKVGNIWEKSSQVDDTRSDERTYQDSSIGNIFGGVQTHLKVPLGPFWVQKGPFMVHMPKKVENLWEKSSQVDVTRSVERTYRASSNGHISGRVRTHLRVQFGPFWVQKGPFMVHLPKKVENLWEKSSQVDDTRSVERTYRASSIENIF
jgi:hypothetical protein